jgi:cytidyltransferase-like protein
VLVCRRTQPGADASQAKALGDVLVVGLIPDSEILRCKGPPVMNEAERFTMVESVKWVDEVLTGVPESQVRPCRWGGSIKWSRQVETMLIQNMRAAMVPLKGQLCGGSAITVSFSKPRID